MCGRFTLLLSWREIHDLLAGFVASLKPGSAPEIEHAPKRYNIAPTQPILVLKGTSGAVAPQLMRWGFMPEWVDDPARFPLIINARAETLMEKTSFKHAVKNTRCVIPASGYYEWTKQADGTKVPNYITRKNGLPILMAGLYATWVGPEGEEMDTAAIVTVDADAQLSKIHHRTPAVLEGEAVGEWLDCANLNALHAMKLLKTFKPETVKYHHVSKQVNSPKNDEGRLIQPVFENMEMPPESSGKPTQLDLF